MENKAHALAAGIFVVLLSALVLGLAAWLTRTTGVRDLYEISTRETVTGLQEQAPVRFRGIDVGKVKKIRFDPKVPGNVLVQMEVDRDTLLGDPNQQRIATALENISDASKATRQLVTNVDTTVKNKLDPALDQITVTVRGAQRTVDQIGATASEFRTTAQRLNAPGGPLERVTE